MLHHQLPKPYPPKISSSASEISPTRSSKLEIREFFLSFPPFPLPYSSVQQVLLIKYPEYFQNNLMSSSTPPV